MRMTKNLMTMNEPPIDISPNALNFVNGLQDRFVKSPIGVLAKLIQTSEILGLYRLKNAPRPLCLLHDNVCYQASVAYNYALANRDASWVCASLYIMSRDWLRVWRLFPWDVWGLPNMSSEPTLGGLSVFVCGHCTVPMSMALEALSVLDPSRTPIDFVNSAISYRLIKSTLFGLVPGSAFERPPSFD